MQCQGKTEVGLRCKKHARTNGFCHLHDGKKTTDDIRFQDQQSYLKGIPRTQSEKDDLTTFYVWVFSAFFFVLALLYGAATGDWDGVVQWLSN